MSSSDEMYLLSPIATGVDGFLGRRLNDEELVEEVMGYMFAGSGKTSLTLTYLLHAISLPENVHAQERLYAEINALPSHDLPTLHQHLISSIGRLYPSFGAMQVTCLGHIFVTSHRPRRATNDCTFWTELPLYRCPTWQNLTGKLARYWRRDTQRFIDASVKVSTFAEFCSEDNVVDRRERRADLGGELR